MILIVDDKPENIFSLEKILKFKGFRTDSALFGEEALKKCLKNEYALIILDVQMPEMDGYEVAEFLSSTKKTKDIPIIFLSAVNREKKYIAKGYESGGIDYITKPVDPEILLLKVNTFYRLYEQTAALHKMQEELQREI
ncbi:response regulator, partial [Sphingobacterium mizutaii]|uniref:response regulator n=1 Tax=Sphingobacterium mizutaii TaxID=1010 RepID=UPI00289A99CF